MHDYHASGIVDRNTNPQPDKAAFVQKTQKLQMPFIANNGQVDEQVEFYAKTFGGTVFVTKDGEIVYALPKSGDGEDEETHRKDAKERGEKYISHKDTENTEERIEGGTDKLCLSVFPAAARDAGNISPPLAGVEGVDGNFDGFQYSSKKSSNPQPAIQHKKSGIALREEFVGARVSGIK